MEKKQANNILKKLKKEYGTATTALKHRNPMQLLVSTILSAQCTDKRVNMVTKELFKKYKTPKDFANAKPEVFEQEIRSTGFYRNKTKNIIGAAKMIVKDFKGKVPDTMEDLIKLPGVARKTANIVLSVAYNKHEGIAVDTHVTRLSYRLGLTKHKNPVKIEQDLMKLVPRKDWDQISLLLIDHGRAVCKAPTPHCSKCFLEKDCPKKGVTKQY